MKPRSLLVCLALVTALSIQGLVAQSLVERGPQMTESQQSSPTGVLLWENRNINVTTSGIVSNDLRGRHPDSSLVNTADDFVVTAGQQWSIDSIHARGFSTVTGVVDSYAVVFYANDPANKPGSIIYQRALIPANGLPRFDSLQLKLPSPVVLQSGTYWISIYAIYNTGTVLSQTRWNWYQGPTAVGFTAHIQDRTGLFGIPPFPWTPVTSLGVPNPSCHFALFGTSSTASADTLLVILQDSTTGTATNIARKKADRDTLFAALATLSPVYRTAYIDTSAARFPSLSGVKRVLYVETSFDAAASQSMGPGSRQMVKDWLNAGTSGDKRRLVMIGADLGYNYSRTGGSGLDTVLSHQMLKFQYRLDNANVTGQNSITGEAVNNGQVFAYTTTPPSTGFWPDGCLPRQDGTVLYRYTGRTANDSVASVGYNATGYVSAVAFQDPRYFTGAFGAVLRSLLQYTNIITDVKQGPQEIPQSFSLEQNFPNPFNPTTTIRYSLPTAAFVQVNVYNVLGQQVAQLQDEFVSPGVHELVWNGRNSLGQNVASGVYFYRLEAKPAGGSPFASLKKMILLK